MVLYSGGLDSILACRVLQEQGVRVTALKFTSPFFGDEAWENPERYIDQVRTEYGIELAVIDITDEYLPMLRKPPHGYGKHFNPCIDCKILMVHRALELMPEFGADFIATGEVIGQRPMSQRKDTLNCITNDSTAHGLLLRPLCARSLRPTIPEKRGWVQRDRLPHISGRGRKVQMELAKKFCITGYPNPGGGCRLADPIQGKRLRSYFARWPEMDGNDCRLAVIGRQFLLPGGWWLVTGRDKRENINIASLRKGGDIFLDSREAPAPSGIVRPPVEKKGEENRMPSDNTLNLAASIILYYCRRCTQGIELRAIWPGMEKLIRIEEPVDRDALMKLAVDE